MAKKRTLLTVTEFAELHGVTKHVVSVWCQRGKIQFEKIGRDRFIPSAQPVPPDRRFAANKTKRKKAK